MTRQHSRNFVSVRSVPFVDFPKCKHKKNHYIGSGTAVQFIFTCDYSSQSYLTSYKSACALQSIPIKRFVCFVILPTCIWTLLKDINSTPSQEIFKFTMPGRSGVKDSQFFKIGGGVRGNLNLTYHFFPLALQ